MEMLFPLVIFSILQIQFAYSSSLCHYDQSLALLHFKQTFSINSSASAYCGDESHPKTMSWNSSSTDCCTWDGVTCDELTGNVIALHLSCSQLHGTIHSNNTLFQLIHLRKLNLAFNNFTHSRISHEFGRFASLTHLNLSRSRFSGQISPEISHLWKLVSLDLSGNYELIRGNRLRLGHQSFKAFLQNVTQIRQLFLSGVDVASVVPRNMSSSLVNLHLSDTGLHGELPDDSIFQLPNLETLDLGRNYGLAGHLPKIQGNNSSRLEELYLWGTGLYGELPDSIGHMKSLKYLILQGCKFSGSIPDSLGNLTSLTDIDLSSNIFSGQVPSTLSNLQHLTSLVLFQNHLEGQIPDSIRHLKSLKYLDLSNCKFSGSVPDSLGNLTRITDIDLSSNNFSGQVPSTLENLQHLTSLDLSFNHLEGQIPDFLGNLQNLSFLSLHQNNFDGHFPSSLANLTQLDYLILSNNSLTGPIPSNISGFQNLLEIDLSDNSFNGTIPSWLFTLPSLRRLYLSSNRLEGQLGEFRNNSLNEIHLSDNELHGPIPHSISVLLNLTDLYLSSNNLSGDVEIGMFSNLKELTTLDLSYNSLSFITNNKANSTLPSSIEYLSLSSCDIKELDFLTTLGTISTLDLSNNKIRGQIPDWAFSASSESLTSLNLSSNSLTGLNLLPLKNLANIDLRSNFLRGPLPIPPLPTSLFLISHNNLTGEIPSSICNLTSLDILDLSHNSLSGVISQCLITLSNQLSVLDLQMNGLHGTIPTTFVNGSKLRNLNLNGNQLEGTIPRSMVNCRSLEVLNLGNNKMNDTFPTWLGILPELQVLVLRSNRFHGAIRSTSKAKRPFLKLRIVDLSHNEFTGLLPARYFKSFKAMMNVDERKMELTYMGEEYYQDSVTIVYKGLDRELVRILTIFTAIDLSSNKFDGEIPNFIGNLNSLRILNLSHNSLAGHIPSCMGNMMGLESLDLSSNQFAGEIPEELTSLTFLSSLNLSQNHLEGRIPRGKQFNTFQNDSYGGNMALCGFPMSKDCGDDKAPQPPLQPVLHEEDDSDFASGFTWKAVLMGYGCGTLLGLVVGYLMFLIGKPKWFIEIVGGRHRKAKKKLATS